MSAYRLNMAILVLVGAAAAAGVAGQLDLIPGFHDRTTMPGSVRTSAERPPQVPAPTAEPADAAGKVDARSEVAALIPPGSSAQDAAAEPDPQAAAAPSFDLVRVEPTGENVIAGRGPPGARVELVVNGRVHDTIVADAAGAFAFVSPDLPVGTSTIVLRATGSDGVQTQSRDSVTVVIAPARDTSPMVALAGPDRPTDVLSQPPPTDQTMVASADPAVGIAPPEQPAPDQSALEQPAPDQSALEQGQALAARVEAPRPSEGWGGQPRIRIASIDAQFGGGLFVTGEAPPGAIVRLYLNDAFIAPGGANEAGKISFAIGRGVRPGDYRVRLDVVDPNDGAVITRAEVDFAVPDLAAAEQGAQPPGGRVAGADPAGTGDAFTTLVPEVSTALVSRGDSLWRISQRIYGSGLRYTEIYDANQQQIRNPNLIYPNQIFVLPSAEDTPATR